MDEFDCGYIYCVWLGDRFPRPKFQIAKIARTGDEIPIGRHPVLDLWNRPNKFYGRRTMEKAIGSSLKIDGNAYIWKVRNRTKRNRRALVDTVLTVPLPHMAARRIGIHRWLYDSVATTARYPRHRRHHSHQRWYRS